MEYRKVALSFTMTVLLLSASLQASPSGESHDTPSHPEVNINTTFIEVMGDVLNSTEPPATPTTSTTPKPQNIVTVFSVPFEDTKPIGEEVPVKVPVKAEGLTHPVASDQSASFSRHRFNPAPQANAETLTSLASLSTVPHPKPPQANAETLVSLPSLSTASTVPHRKPPQTNAETLTSLESLSTVPHPKPNSPVEAKIAAPNNEHKGTLIQEQKTFISTNGSPIQLSSTSFTSNESLKDVALDPIVASLLKDFQRNTRTPNETKLPTTSVKKEEALPPNSKVMPIPVITPHVLHVDPQTGQVFVQRFEQAQVTNQMPRVPETPSPSQTQPSDGSGGRWLWNLFGWNKKPSAVEPTKPSPGLHIIKAKKNAKPGEPYYDCPLVKALPPQKQQQQRSPLFFL